MLKPLMANIGDLGDYINCKIGQTPQLFHSANRIFHCPWIRFHPHSRVPTKERRTRTRQESSGQLLSFPLRGPHRRPLSIAAFVLVTHMHTRPANKCISWIRRAQSPCSMPCNRSWLTADYASRSLLLPLGKPFSHSIDSFPWKKSARSVLLV